MAARTRTVKAPPASAATKPRTPKAQAAAKANARTPTGKPEVRIFVSYSHVDAAARAKLETHLAPLIRDGVSTWFDGRMDPGDALDAGISRALRQAHILVALLSPEYISSRYCQLEYNRAMTRRAKGLMRVVGVVVRPCGWKETTAAGFKLLPEDGRSVPEWRSADAAFLDVAQGLGKLVRTVRAEMAKGAANPAKPSPRTNPLPKPKAPTPIPKGPAKAAAPKPKRETVKAASNRKVMSPSKPRTTAAGRKRPTPKAR
ncbi:toll/interleukin-1 receptor domain-containing protein [Methylorubrum rhodesianum]|jgi:TIR domain|uniref:toll/interleukin-1 receptor domain-containing protein n=1 Tax=Methylorubrum rhodesianum TaxID=29427 RepID=UPI00374763B5